ncbi:hypothetical protein, partial [Myxococcus sp. CA033]|uniref:hypothetical protein n=1 Tax=Myxococcus sp. CA033 TaxID=2741516 RepID=UPI001C2DDD12
LPATLLPPSTSFRRQRGASSISSSRSLSTTQFRFSSLLLPEVSSAAQWLPLLLSGGRGFYLFAASRVNRCFVDSLAASALLLPGLLRRGAASTTAASSVNSLR